jgi:hypothetical protein
MQHRNLVVIVRPAIAAKHVNELHHVSKTQHVTQSRLWPLLHGDHSRPRREMEAESYHLRLPRGIAGERHRAAGSLHVQTVPGSGDRELLLGAETKLRLRWIPGPRLSR